MYRLPGIFHRVKIPKEDPFQHSAAAFLHHIAAAELFKIWSGPDFYKSGALDGHPFGFVNGGDVHREGDELYKTL